MAATGQSSAIRTMANDREKLNIIVLSFSPGTGRVVEGRGSTRGASMEAGGPTGPPCADGPLPCARAYRRRSVEDLHVARLRRSHVRCRVVRLTPEWLRGP